jgi:hypothetical protein
MWKCPKCGESIEDQFDSCWKCAPVPEEEKPRKERRPLPLRKLVRYLIALVVLGLIWLGFFLPGALRRREAEREAQSTVDRLQPVVGSDARFARVRVWRSGEHITVGGIVESEDHERALESLVFHQNPAQDVKFTIEITSSLK